MPNSYFQFKQFTVNQDRSAMKVTTDACLFGGWIAAQEFSQTKNILDIGAGTGLLMLMIAQKSCAEITGIEIEENACNQCIGNIKSSPWSERLHVIHLDIKNYTTEKKFGLIISNPPFYDNQLKSPDAKRNIAHHQSSLNFENLFWKVISLLEPDGFFAVLVPASETGSIKNIGFRFSLSVFEEVKLKQTPAHNYFRSILVFQNKKGDKTIESEITIKDAERNYTSEFSILLKDYYLHL
ncbi:tRNA1(Val) (adenine(37)-N6)-methyltransferase [Pollutibacter soli]|uniref:tRNA1(Val) (adenine(37)-N6)-methyltransferase n=1 Tax=Pollutibacter soli TaxID=3034157 RepID=UPI003013B359